MGISLRYSARGAIVPEIYLQRMAEGVLLFACLFAVGFFQPEYVVRSVLLAELDLNVFVEDRSGSNLFSQVKWLLLAAVSGLLVCLRTDRFLKLAAMSWPLILLMAVAMLTVLWSVDASATMRRGARSIIFVFVIMAAMAYVRDWKRALIVIYLAYWALFLQNMVGFAIPGTFDIFGNYTGATSQKNQLGILAAVGILVGMWVRSLLVNPMHRALNWFYLAGWFALMMLSFSKTTLGLVVVTPLVVVGFVSIGTALRLSVGATIFLVLSVVFLVMALLYGVSGMTPMDFGRLIKPDLTFTGRTQIWEFLYEKVQDRLIGGFGFGAFWGQGMDSPSLTAPYPYIWYLDSAHNGYLEIVANMGLLGGGAMLLVLFHLSLAIDQVQRKDRMQAYMMWWLVIFILCHSMMESSLLRPTETGMWFLFVFVYLTALRDIGDRRAGPSHEDDDGTPRGDATVMPDHGGYGPPGPVVVAGQ